MKIHTNLQFDLSINTDPMRSYLVTADTTIQEMNNNLVTYLKLKDINLKLMQLLHDTAEIMCNYLFGTTIFCRNDGEQNISHATPRSIWSELPRIWQFLMGNDRTTLSPVLFSDLLFRAILCWQGQNDKGNGPCRQECCCSRGARLWAQICAQIKRGKEWGEMSNFPYFQYRVTSKRWAAVNHQIMRNVLTLSPATPLCPTWPSSPFGKWGFISTVTLKTAENGITYKYGSSASTYSWAILSWRSWRTCRTMFSLERRGHRKEIMNKEWDCPDCRREHSLRTVQLGYWRFFTLKNMLLANKRQQQMWTTNFL